MTSKTIAATLHKSGLVVCENFLSARLLQYAANDFIDVRASAQFRRAGIGKGIKTSHGARNDETFWLDREHKTQTQRLLWRKLDLLKAAFNRSMFLGLTHFEGHYAAYPEGGFYERHKDCFRGDSGRVISFVLYLNRNWKAADGGRLRVYSADSFTDVDPNGGTMVCFLSESEHEVLLSHRERFSLTGWFKRN